MTLAVAVLLGSFTAWAAGIDKTKPTTPGNFRVVSLTAYTVTGAWSPSTDNSGNFNYHLAGAYHVTPAILPKTATSHTFTALFPGNQYWFFIYAKDAAGNASAQANLGPVRLPSDTTPESQRHHAADHTGQFVCERDGRRQHRDPHLMDPIHG
jgi:chitodextrinase